MAQQDQTQNVPSASQNVAQDVGQMPQAGQMPTVPVGGDPTSGFTFAGAQQDYQNAIMAGWAMPGARTPHMAVPVPNMRMPAPPMQVPMQDPQPRPTDTSVYARRTAKQQGFGNMLGNALGMIANQKNQQNYMNRVNTLEEYGKAKVREAEANRVLKIYPDDAAAKQVLNDAQTEIKRMENDPKESKWLTDAMPNYIDPKKDKYSKERNEAWQRVNRAEVTGTINDNQAQVTTSDKSDQIQGIPPPPPQGRAGQPQQPPMPQQTIPANIARPTPGTMGGGGPVPQMPATQGAPVTQGMTPAQPGQLNRRDQNIPTPPMGGTFQGAGTYPGNIRFAQQEAAKAQARQTPPPPPPSWHSRFNIPTELQTTPEYASAMAQQQKYETAYLEKMLPEAEKAAAEVYKVKVQQGNQNFRRILEDNMKLQETYMNNITRANIADAKNKTELQKQGIASAAVVKAAEVRAGYMSMALMSDPRFAPFAGAFAARYTKQYSDQIAKMTTENSQLEKQISDAKIQLGNDPLHPGHPIKPGTPERARIEEQIRAASAQMDNNNTTIRRLQQDIDQVNAMAAGAQQQGQGAGGQQGGGLSSNIDQAARTPGVAGNIRLPEGVQPNSPYANGVRGLLAKPSDPTSWMNMTKNFEGFSPTAYGDAGRKGGRDIGFGHSIQPGEKIASEIDVPTANTLFAQDYRQAQNIVSNALGTTQVPAVAGAILTDLAYQSGKIPQDLATAVKNGDWNKAADLLYAQRNNSGPGAVATLTKRFGLTSQVLRQLGGGDTSAAARAGTTDSSGQPAIAGGTTAGIPSKPSAAITVDQTRNAQQAAREAFGTEPILSPATVPTTPDYDATQDSTSGEATDEDTTADREANAAP